MRRRTGMAMVIAVAVAVAGCGERYDVRTGEWTLDRAVSRAFKRNYAAAYRMRTGQANSGIVRHADVRCRALEPQPDEDSRPWRWRCRVRWYLHGSPRAGLATYGVRVDERGCFEARSGAFPGNDPLVYIRSCP